jgi:hypothetical protein
VNVNGTLVEAKMWTFTLESTHFIFIKCPIYTHDGASSKFSTNSQETDYSAGVCIHTAGTMGGGGEGDPGPQTDKHLPPSIFIGQLLRNTDI